MIDLDNGYEIIKCPYCGEAYHCIPGFQGEDGNSIAYTIHVKIEETTRGIRKSIKLFTKISNRISKQCRKAKVMLTCFK
jgi:hypothetical protein